MGTLYVVATPIGNLDDISPRALQTLANVSLIAAEDTRHSKRLLRHFAIQTPLVSYHQHNERERRDLLLRALDAGDVALISDAGTPAVSDPGADLVSAALAAGHTVSPIPGPSALAAAVSASGLIAGPFVALGFLPREMGQRRQAIARAGASGMPFVLFEAARRLPTTLAELRDALGERDAVVLRELTKLHEEIRRDTLGALQVWAARTQPPGEVVVVVGAAPAERPEEDDVARLLRDLRMGGLSASQAAREAAAITGLPRSELYRLARDAASPSSVGLERELPLADEDTLQDALGDEKGPQRGQP
jgi:16S rRNA (cytidine1402-2'-O)-methyltransferase